MNKSDLIAVVLLFALLMGWGFFQKKNVPVNNHQPAGQEQVTNGISATNATIKPVVATNTLNKKVEMPAATVETNKLPATVEHKNPEQIVTVSNALLKIDVTSWGGGISHAYLMKYPETMEEDSPPVNLDFSNNPALSLLGLPGFSNVVDFKIEKINDNTVAVSRKNSEGITFKRTIKLEDNYQLIVNDSFINESGKDIKLDANSVVVSPMPTISSNYKARRYAYLGIDTLSETGGKKVEHWLKMRIFKKSIILKKFTEKGKNVVMPPEVSVDVNDPMLWVAVKNKFFTQILVPSEPSISCSMYAARDMAARKLTISRAWANVTFAGKNLASGTTVTRNYNFYIGPKKYSILKKRGLHQGDIMEFGSWYSPVSKFLLVILNLLYKIFHNYGIAIIVLTILVRVAFWPITHKGTESMQRMQKIQPLVAAVREKYKDNPQKMNQEVMLLYKQHNVNPMGGCLPMLIQIPVFIALFTILRSAVELRYSSFLWVKDLSEPEMLFAGMIPVIGSLNILPLIMTGTMILQQHLTPTSGDPQQKKMMMFMPLIMLFIFYNMPSALTLYWSVSQGIAILQLVHQRRKSQDEEVAAPVQQKISRPVRSSGKKRKRKK